MLVGLYPSVRGGRWWVISSSPCTTIKHYAAHRQHTHRRRSSKLIVELECFNLFLALSTLSINLRRLRHGESLNPCLLRISHRIICLKMYPALIRDPLPLHIIQYLDGEGSGTHYPLVSSSWPLYKSKNGFAFLMVLHTKVVNAKGATDAFNEWPSCFFFLLRFVTASCILAILVLVLLAGVFCTLLWEF